MRLSVRGVSGVASPFWVTLGSEGTDMGEVSDLDPWAVPYGV